MNQAWEREILDLVEKVTPALGSMNPGEVARSARNKWSVKEILGHLIDSACNNHQRFVRALDTEELVFPPYEPATWVEKQNYHDADWSTLVRLFEVYNRHLAHVVHQIPASKHETPCRVESAEPVTLGFMVQDYMRHLRHHLRAMGVL